VAKLAERWAAFRDPQKYAAMSIGDPAFAAFMRGSVDAFGWDSFVALRQPAYFRGVSLIAQTIAALPLRVYRNVGVDDREELHHHWMTNRPAGPYAIPSFNFWEQVIFWNLTMGEAGLLHLVNGNGGMAGFLPIAPQSYDVTWGADGLKHFAVTFGDGQLKHFTSDEFTQIMGLSTDGLRAVSPLTLFRRQFDLSRAQDEAAARAMTSGMLVGGLVSAEEDISADDAKMIKDGLDAKVSGPQNANGLAFVNRKLEFKSWQSTNTDLTYVAGREFSVSEVSRMLGIPPHMLGLVDRSTSWGTGIQEQNAMFQRQTLMGVTSRIECAISCKMPQPQFIEWDYAGLLAGTPAESEALLLSSVEGGLRTPNEARKKLNLPPDPDPASDKLRQPAAAGTTPPTEPKASRGGPFSLQHADNGAIT
jgi:HK97 family phage portal protein